MSKMLKDRLGTYCEVQFAGVAAVEAVLARRDPIFTLALRASDAIRPETAFQILAGGRFVREKFKQFERADR